MVLGRFGDTSGRPFIEASIIFPRLEIRGDISFLVDTGADSSIIMPTDAIRLDIDFEKLTGKVSSTGIGGSIDSFSEEAIVLFSDGESFFAFRLIVGIHQVAEGIDDIPSLLGRDILDRTRMIYEPSKKLLAFESMDCDLKLPIPTA